MTHYLQHLLDQPRVSRFWATPGYTIETDTMKYKHPSLSLPQCSNCLLSEGEHLGYQWAVLHNGMAYRCGYVALPPGHPWHGKGYDDIPAEAHGGLTYSNASDDGSWWVGFDCAHAGDAPDPTLPGYRERGDTLRSQEYVEEQCRSLCEQATKAVDVPPVIPSPLNERVQRIRTLLKRYQEETSSEDEHLVSDLLADLAHYCDSTFTCLGDALEKAENQYLEEVDLSDGKPIQFFGTYPSTRIKKP